MPNAGRKGGTGGAANEAGSEFRASVAAWVVVQALLGMRLEALEQREPQAEVPTGTLLFEVDAPVDDIEVHLHHGARLYIQAKRSLSISELADSDFGRAVSQLVEQVTRGPFSPGTRMAVVVGTPTEPLRTLKAILSRMRSPAQVQLNSNEQEVWSKFERHARALSEDEQRLLFDATVFVLLDLEESERRACIAQLESGVVGPGEGLRAWNVLEQRVRRLAKGRKGSDLDGWIAALKEGGVTLRADRAGAPGPRRVAVSSAIARYREYLIENGKSVWIGGVDSRATALDVSPDTRELIVNDPTSSQSTSSLDGPCLSWAARRRKRTLLLGLPGVGKSASLRRLAAEVATLSWGPLPLIVSLPTFAEALARGGNEIETLVEVGLLKLPSDERAVLAEELLHGLRSVGRSLILLDSLDECRTSRPGVLRALRSVMSELHEDVEVVLATRDTAFADASSLGFYELELQPPRSMAPALHRLAALILSREGLDPNECERRASEITERVMNLTSRTTLEETPLARLGMVVIAVRDGVDALGRGHAVALSALVDFVARQWEIAERRPDFSASADFTAGETVEYMIHAFEKLAEVMDRSDGPNPEDLVRELASWTQAMFHMAPTRARATARNAVMFWEEVGIYVASGAPAKVGVRQMALHEIGLARWLAKHAPEQEREEWLEAHASDPDRLVAIVHLASLHEESALWLIDMAVRVRSLDLVLRLCDAMAEMSKQGEAYEGLVSLLVDAALFHLREAGAGRWQVFSRLLQLDLLAGDVKRIMDCIAIGCATKELHLAELTARIRWQGCDELEDEALIRALPSEFREYEDHHLSDGYVEVLTDRLGPERGNVAQALRSTLHVSWSTHWRVISTLDRQGYSLKQQAFEPEFTEEAQAHFDATVHLVPRKMFEILGTWAEPREEYAERRRMCELSDFVTTAWNGTVLSDLQEAFRDHQELSTEALELIARLSGADRNLIADCIRVREAEVGRDRWILGLEYAACVRKLDRWPESRKEIEELLDRLLKLFAGTAWTVLVAMGGMVCCPDRELVLLALNRLPQERFKSEIEWLRNRLEPRCSNNELPDDNGAP